MQAFRADKDVFGVPPVLGNEIPWKEGNLFSALGAGFDLDPQEILHVCLSGATHQAFCSKEVPDFLFKGGPYPVCSFAKGISVSTAGDADTIISNAYKSDLIYRATGSNMGESDTLEIFSIYAQASTSSAEYSRALVKFPISSITTDRSNDVIPASGSVTFYLRMFKAVIE